MASGPGTRCHPVVVGDEVGGAIVAWEDAGGGSANIFAGHANATPGTGVPPSSPLQKFSLSGFRPNPSSLVPVRVEFELPTAEPAKLDLIDTSGRRLLMREVGGLGPGTHVLEMDTPLPAGLYWVRLQQGGRSLTTRGVVVR